MAGSSNDTVFITPSPKNAGFPPYLDFTTLRSNAINYLGPITGKYWTDYNIHDPGITTLEVLLYALMDLGYRTNLPIGSLLAGSGTGGKFFTPAQALGCNPTAVLDYRKLLMDLDEVRNAWLEPDQSRFNGLYVIYLETEKAQADFSTPGEWEKYKHGVALKVKKVVHAFRNLCEDFEKIVFLKKTYIGVNVDVEIVPGTDTTVVYRALVQALYDFFSPVPTFYTLGQLTAMNVSLDTVFEGRPYTGRASHGFLLDDDMPDRPSGEQSIYKSVLVQGILGVTGIKTVRSLVLLDENKNPLASSGGKWEYPLGADTLPAFWLTGSSFQWYQNGQLLSTQLGSYNAILELNSLHSGKVIYPAGSTALDVPAPNVAPLNGLGDYYSIQNDYPLVYGIGPGGLPPTASVLRQSQAWQFKGYLLFFDQLLADYLAQLSNVWQLFSMNAPAGGSTYFGGNLGTVPDLNNLLRFPPTGAAGGATLLYPVVAKEWSKVMAGGSKVCVAGVGAIAAYTFRSAVERDTTLATVTVLFSSAQLSVKTIELDNGQWMYYLTGTDDVFVLISRNTFSNEAGAMGEAKTVLYIGANQDSYSLVSLGEISSYTFNLVGSGTAYYQYLQSILEKPGEYTARRTAFLEHLLARFAETFTDYALLEAGFASNVTILDQEPGLMQRFLGEWPALSADRGKAFDYRLDGWNSTNTSGMEQRFKAYCGIADTRRHFLCHFEVQKKEEYFYIVLSLAEEAVFTCREPLEQKDVLAAVFSLQAALADRENYRVVYRKAEASYWVEVIFYGNLTARTSRGWLDEASALDAAETFFRMWQRAPVKGDIVVSDYQYRPQLLDHEGRVVRTAVAGLLEEREAFEYGVSRLAEINEEEVWARDANIGIGELCRNKAPELPGDRWIDINRFKIYPRQDVVGRSERWSFEVLDGDNTFRFESILDFDSQAAARDACCQLLHFLCEPGYYTIRKEHGDWFRLVIRAGDIEWAQGEWSWESEERARERIPLIVLEARRRLYTLHVISRPYRWKFLFFLGLPEKGSMVFKSVASFETQQESVAAARAFHEAGAHWRWRETEEGIFLEAELPDRGRLICRDSAQGSRGEFPVAVFEQLLQAKKDIYQLAAGDQEMAGRMIVPDETSKEGAYVYRLVDKDHPRAYHVPHAGPVTKAEAEALRDGLITKADQGYPYLEICLGGDNIRTGRESGKYYWMLRCRNDYFAHIGVPGGELVLFESMDGFDDADTAQTAFQQSYLEVLKKAGDPDNYGAGKYIALREPEKGADHPPVVLVPIETREAFEQAGLEVVEELAKAALSYPIRMEGKNYRFVLGNDWRSSVEYHTAVDAQAGFELFLLLLNFQGNFFIEFDWAACTYRVGIREVLAESTHRFPSEADAWGPRGVEKFICVAQHRDGFHLNRREDCTYSYFIACPNLRAIHPCMYESAAQRDQALQRLMQEAGYFFADGWMDHSDPHHFLLLNGRGHAVARVPALDFLESRLNRIFDILDAIWAGKQPERYGSDMQLIVGEGADRFAIEPAGDWSEKEWMKKLSDVATYFPVTREGTVQGGSTVYTYRFEFKLPGFEDPSLQVSFTKDCGCPPVPEGEPPFCYLAWKDEEVFKHARGAWEAWLALLPVLGDKENYRPVFGEKIGCYGIELLDKRAILARNPQTYSYAAMAVESVARAKERINAEGLDVVEHLLLRPGLSDTEIPVCSDQGPCDGVWGADPYSFVVTVALPAWPARFRAKENRVLLESILQREMPAHILARILWLTPMDMCRFEHLYAGWIDGLARVATEREACSMFKAADFAGFLFQHSMACLGECKECGEGGGGVQEDMIGEWLSEINRLYCWKDRKCAGEWEEVGPMEIVIVETVEVVEVAVEAVEAIFEVRPPDVRLIRKVQADRRGRYEKKISDWQGLTGEERPAETVRAFLLDPLPSMKRLEDTFKEILKRAGKKTARHQLQQELAEIVLAIYLDRICVQADEDERWQHLRKTVGKSGVRIGNVVEFYLEWRSDEMRQLVPGLEVEKIQEFIREASKE